MAVGMIYQTYLGSWKSCWLYLFRCFWGSGHGGIAIRASRSGGGEEVGGKY